MGLRICESICAICFGVGPDGSEVGLGCRVARPSSHHLAAVLLSTSSEASFQGG